LEVILQDYNKRLSQNLVYSEDNIKIGGEVVETKINNSITYGTFIIDVTPENIDLDATWKSRGQSKGIDKLVFNEYITKQLIDLNLNKYPLYQFESFTNTRN
jgi:hypothetical protein